MANIERDKSEDLSVEELVSKLKNNIDSDEIPSADDARKKQDSMRKKHDEGGDIASMLKRFLPEDSEQEEFEVEDASETLEDAEFELEAEDAQDEAFDEIEESDGGPVVYEQLELDAEFEPLAEENPVYNDVDADREDEFEFSEDESATEDQDDSEFEFNDPDLFDIPEQTVGADSLLAGFASVLEETYSPEESQLIAAAVLEANGIDAQTGNPIRPEQDRSEQDVQPEIDLAGDELEELPDFEGLMTENLSDFREITPPDVSALATEETDEAFEVGEAEEADAAEEAPDFFENTQEKFPEEFAQEDEDILPEQDVPASQLYTFDAPVVPEAEEEYYADDAKKPLAFDTDDEGPVVPDESAFADVDNAQDIEARMMVENKFSELSEDELNLMVALGYESQISDEGSIKKADEIAEKNSSEIVDPIDVDNSFAFDGVELSSSDQFRAVRNRYKQEHKVMKIRLIGTIILALALLFFETFTALADTGAVAALGGALNINRYPVVNIMISLQLVVLACALSWHRLLMGLRDAVLFRPSPISVTSVAILCCVIYDVIMAVMAPGVGLRTYNLTAVVFLLGLVVGDYLNLSREIRAFNTLSTRKPKFALANVSSDGYMADGESYAYERNFEVENVEFVENYFRRTNVSTFNSTLLNMIIFPFVALAVILGIVSYMSNGVAVTAFNIAILTVVVGMPLSALFIMCYPIYSAVKLLFKKDATIIGDPSVEEYSDATSVVFPDKEVFPMSSTIMRGIKLYDNENISIYYVLSNLTKFYSRVGGPLKEILAQTTSEVPAEGCTELVRIEEDGVEALIDGEINILAGQRAFVERNGITVDEDPDDARMAGEGVSALFVVFDGKLCAKLYVQYDIDHSFEDIINSLATENVDTYIKTADPCIDDALLASKLRISRFPARVIKRSTEELPDSIVESSDSGIVSRNNLGGIADAVVLCNRIKRVRKTSRSVCVVSAVIGLVVMLFLALFSSAPNILSVYTVIYQLFWMIPMILFTKLFIK